MVPLAIDLSDFDAPETIFAYAGMAGAVVAVCCCCQPLRAEASEIYHMCKEKFEEWQTSVWDWTQARFVRRAELQMQAAEERERARDLQVIITEPVVAEAPAARQPPALPPRPTLRSPPPPPIPPRREEDPPSTSSSLDAKENEALAANKNFTASAPPAIDPTPPDVPPPIRSPLPPLLTPQSKEAAQPSLIAMRQNLRILKTELASARGDKPKSSTLEQVQEGYERLAHRAPPPPKTNSRRKPTATAHLQRTHGHRSQSVTRKPHPRGSAHRSRSVKPTTTASVRRESIAV